MGHTGLTRQDQRIMDLRDRGLTPGMIAAELGIAHATAARVVGMYGASQAEDARDRASMRRSSARLRDATLAYLAARGTRNDREGARC